MIRKEDVEIYELEATLGMMANLRDERFLDGREIHTAFFQFKKRFPKYFEGMSFWGNPPKSGRVVELVEEIEMLGMIKRNNLDYSVFPKKIISYLIGKRIPYDLFKSEFHEMARMFENCFVKKED